MGSSPEGVTRPTTKLNGGRLQRPAAIPVVWMTNPEILWPTNCKGYLTFLDCSKIKTGRQYAVLLLSNLNDLHIQNTGEYIFEFECGGTTIKPIVVKIHSELRFTTSPYMQLVDFGTTAFGEHPTQNEIRRLQSIILKPILFRKEDKPPSQP